MIEIKRLDKVNICDCCGEKIQNKVPRFIIRNKIQGIRTNYICYKCVENILIDYIIKEANR